MAFKAASAAFGGGGKIGAKGAAPALAKRVVVPMDVLLLYDASSALNEAEYRAAKEAGNVLMMMFEDDAQIAFAQYADEVAVACPLTSDRFEHQTKHKQLKQMKGASRLASALEHAKGMFAEGGRAEANKLVFLLAGGAADQPAAAVAAAQALRDGTVRCFLHAIDCLTRVAEQKAAIIGVGIGKFDRALLEQVCGGAGNVYPEAELQTIMDRIPALEVMQ